MVGRMFFESLRHETEMNTGGRLSAFPALIALLVLFGVGASTAVSAQQAGTVTGMVTDTQSGTPLTDAQVSIQGTSLGGLTNASGRYLLTQVPIGTQTVRVERLGHATASQTVNVAAGAPTIADFSLRQSAIQLEGIVVTGTPGAQRLRELGNSIGQIDMVKRAETSASAHISDALIGAEPGVEMSIGSGGHDGSANIRIRGAASIGLSSEPLIYVDGVRVSNAKQYGPGTSYRDGGLRLNDFDPNEIASIEVVKGPAAATLYGTEASNGVINILTKSGSNREGSSVGQPTRISMSLGAGFVSLPGLQSGPEFYDLEIGYRCQGISGECTTGEIVRVNALQNDLDRFGRDYFRKGTTQTYNANVSGASEDMQYFFSGSWEDQKGITFDSWKKKLNARANLGWTPNDKIRVQFGLGVVWSDTRSNASNQPWSLGVTFQCPAPTCEPGSGPAALDGPLRGYFAYTPYAMVDHVFGGEQLNRQTATMTITQKPWDWFNGRFTVGADWVDTNNHELYQPLPAGRAGHFRPNGQKSVRSGHEASYTIDYSATAAFDLTSDWNLSTSAGFQYFQRTNLFYDARGTNFPISTLSTVSSGSVRTSGEFFEQSKNAGIYFQETAAWQDRLFVTAAMRFDDNSAFGQNFELVSYPKVSASWIASESQFMEDWDWVDQVKVRGAWGKAGQQPSTFAAIRTYEPVSGPGGLGTITRDNIGNPDVQPEVGAEWEVGFDGAFFDQRIALETTYYSQTRNAALIQVEVRPSSGFGGSQWRNLGMTSNKGIEIGAQISALRDGAVGLDFGLAFSNNKSKVVSLGGLPPVELHGSNPTTNWGHQRFAEGFPMGAIFLKKVVSATITAPGTPEARATNIMCEGGDIEPGGDVLSWGGGAPVPCDGAPEIYRGTPISPTIMSTNATLTLLGGDLEFYVQVDTKLGGTRIDANLAGAHVFVNSSLAILERTDPILLALQEMAADGINQTGLVDADFARLRHVSATYRLPDSWSGIIGGRNGTFTLSGYNVGWLWRAQSHKFGLKTLDSESRVTGRANGLQAVHHEGWPTELKVRASLRITY